MPCQQHGVLCRVVSPSLQSHVFPERLLTCLSPGENVRIVFLNVPLSDVASASHSLKVQSDDRNQRTNHPTKQYNQQKQHQSQRKRRLPKNHRKQLFLLFSIIGHGIGVAFQTVTLATRVRFPVLEMFCFPPLPSENVVVFVVCSILVVREILVVI